jgi:F0F1-type ATP synthase assembly protein I
MSGKSVDRYYYLLAIRVTADIGFGIAIPALVAATVGIWADEKFGTQPWILFILLIIAAVTTAIYVVRKAYYYADLYKNGPEK